MTDPIGRRVRYHGQDAGTVVGIYNAVTEPHHCPTCSCPAQPSPLNGMLIIELDDWVIVNGAGIRLSQCRGEGRDLHPRMKVVGWATELDFVR